MIWRDFSRLFQIIVVRDGGKQSLPLSKTAGLASLRATLGSNARTLLDMAAGSTFKETNRLEERRRVRVVFSTHFLPLHFCCI